MFDELLRIQLVLVRRKRELEATSELGLHLGVYRRFGSGAVVHTHAPMATALSRVLNELPVVHYLMMTDDKALLDRLPGLTRWWRSMNERPGVTKTAPQLG